jgi:hypothetical protein
MNCEQAMIATARMSALGNLNTLSGSTKSLPRMLANDSASFGFKIGAGCGFLLLFKGSSLPVVVVRRSYEEITIVRFEAVDAVPAATAATLLCNDSLAAQCNSTLHRQKKMEFACAITKETKKGIGCFNQNEAPNAPANRSRCLR